MSLRERRRVVARKFAQPAFRTKQEPKAACDINNVVANAKRGIAPSWINRRQPIYTDVSEVPRDLAAAYAEVQAAEEAFMALPSQVRSAIDNDPRRLPDWLSDKANLSLAVQHGLVEAPEAEPEEEPAKDLPPKKSQAKPTAPPVDEEA